MLKSHGIAQAQQVQRIIDARGYRAPSGHWIDLSASIRRSVAGTAIIGVDDVATDIEGAGAVIAERFQLIEMSTLGAVQYLARSGWRSRRARETGSSTRFSSQFATAGAVNRSCEPSRRLARPGLSSSGSCSRRSEM